jgi:hypothetical protein
MPFQQILPKASLQGTKVCCHLGLCDHQSFLSHLSNRSTGKALEIRSCRADFSSRGVIPSLFYKCHHTYALRTQHFSRINAASLLQFPTSSWSPGATPGATAISPAATAKPESSICSTRIYAIAVYGLPSRSRRKHGSTSVHWREICCCSCSYL